MRAGRQLLVFWLGFYTVLFLVTYFFYFQNHEIMQISILMWTYGEHWIGISGAEYVLLFIKWLPLFLNYLVIEMILFSTMQCVIGYVVGFNRKVGKLRTWNSLKYFFMRSLQKKVTLLATMFLERSR